MTHAKNLLAVTVAVGLMHIGAVGVHAQNLLTNGDFEPVGPPQSEIPGWTLAEHLTGSPSTVIDAALQQGFGNQPGPLEDEFGLWLRPWAGDTSGTMNRPVDAVLSQELEGVAGETYTLTGWSRFEPNYAGGVETLDFLSPSGGIASPTDTLFEIAFLDASSEVIGSPVTLDLFEDRPSPPNDDAWREHTLMGVAPEGTESVRVTASMTDGRFNINPMQSAFVDNFSLTASSSSTELLSNALLNEQPAEQQEFEGWEVTELPEDSDTLSEAGFASYPGSGGTSGVWVRGFNEGDGILAQTVPGMEGGEYTFSAWSAFEQFYTGGFEDTTTDTFMEMAFLNASEEEIETPLRINLVDEGQMNDQDGMGLEEEDWRQFFVSGTAPAGTEFVRVSAGAIGMSPGDDSPQSAFFDDFSLTLESGPMLAGDFNSDGVVDARDYVVWRDNLGQSIALPNEVVTPGMVTSEDYGTWQAQYGASSALAGAAAAPEPAGLGLICCVLALGAVGKRRRLVQAT